MEFTLKRHTQSVMFIHYFGTFELKFGIYRVGRQRNHHNAYETFL